MDDLATAVTQLIPEATNLEGEYWTISDIPSTAGGKWVTLNVGSIELVYVPKALCAVGERLLVLESDATAVHIKSCTWNLVKKGNTDDY